MLLQSGALGLPGGGAYLGQRMPQRMEAPLGGRLARRPLDPAAEAERRAQQEKLYSLDIARIRSGERGGRGRRAGGNCCSSHSFLPSPQLRN